MPESAHIPKPFRAKVSAATLVHQMQQKTHAPLSAMIEIADRCNEVCLHCYQIQGQKGEMTTEQLKKVIDDLADLGVLFLTISGGEATLRSDFLEIVEHARMRQFAVKLFTNGLTMTQALAQALANLAVQEVQISLYSTRAEAHDAITGVKGSWQKSVQGMRYLRQAGVAVVMKSPLMKVNAAEYKDYVAMAQELGVDYMMDPGGLDPRENGDRGPELLSPPDAEMKRVLSDPTLSSQTGLTHPVGLNQPLCGACSGNVHIEAHGEVRPCTLLDVACGNALSDGVASAYHSQTSQGIRDLKWSDVVGCRVCDLRDHCARCFARSKAESGDALKPYPSACHAAQLRYEVAFGTAATIINRHNGRETGPYRNIGEHCFETRDDALDADDVRKREKLPWLVQTPSVPPSSGLVQLRRPNQSKKVDHRATV